MPLGVGHGEVLEQHRRRHSPWISPVALELHTQLVDCDQSLEKPPLALDLGNLGGVRDRILARHLATSVCSWSSSGYTRTRTPRSVGGYGRIVAMCRVGGADLNAWMVELGRAVAYRKCSRRYVSREASRRAERRKVWREGVRSPRSRLRRAERLSGVPRSDSGECCARPVRVNRNYRP